MGTHSKKEAVLILDNLRSAHNVGSLFRTADAAGVSKIYLVGTTPAPVDRFNRVRSDIAKVSLGAEQAVPWEQATDASALIEQLKSDGVTLYALEQHPRAENYRACTPQTPFALVVGAEVEGVSKIFLEKSEHILEIPQHGKKESLNVSVAAGIALYHMLGS